MRHGYFVRHKKVEDGYYFEILHDGHIYSGKMKSMMLLKRFLNNDDKVIRFISEHKKPVYLLMTEVYMNTGTFSASKYFTSNEYVFRH